MLGRPVFRGAVIDDLAEDRVDDQPPPRPGLIGGEVAGGVGRDRAIAIEPTRLVIDTGQRFQADDHADVGLQAVFGGELTGESGEDRIDEQVRAQLIQRARVLRWCQPGAGVELGVTRLGLRGG